MRGAKRVGPYPFQELEIFDQQGRIEPFADEVEILVLAETPQKDRFVVEQKFRLGDGDRTETGVQVVAIYDLFPVDEFHAQGVEMRVLWRPGFSLSQFQLSGRLLCLAHNLFAVYQGNQDIVVIIPRDFDAIG